MRITMMKCKIHRATVTGADLSYEGSISIDPVLCKAAGLLAFERVDIYDCNNGNRLSTYVLPGKPGEICLNGAAARLVHAGDEVIIVSYCELEADEVSTHRPRVVLVDGQNAVRELLEHEISV